MMVDKPKVVRWDYFLYDDEMSEKEDGGFVEYDDYEALAARVQELEDALEYGRDVSKQSQAENKRLREALVGIRTAAMRWKMRMPYDSDKVRSRESIQHTINLVDAALKEKP